jgi:hypothetical protein
MPADEVLRGRWFQIERVRDFFTVSRRNRTTVLLHIVQADETALAEELAELEGDISPDDVDRISARLLTDALDEALETSQTATAVALSLHGELKRWRLRSG